MNEMNVCDFGIVSILTIQTELHRVFTTQHLNSIVQSHTLIGFGNNTKEI